MNYYRRDSARILKQEDNSTFFAIAFAYCQAQSDTTVLSSTVRYNGAVKHSQIQRCCQEMMQCYSKRVPSVLRVAEKRARKDGEKDKSNLLVMGCPTLPRAASHPLSSITKVIALSGWAYQPTTSSLTLPLPPPPYPPPRR